MLVRRIAFSALAIAACGDSGGSAGDSESGDGTTAIPMTSSSSGTTSPATTATTTAGDASSSSGADVTGSSESTGPAPGSAGCGMPAQDPTAQWSGRTLDLDGVTREYWVFLPEPYDPQRAYPVVYQFHGCSGSEDRQNNNPPVQDHSGADAIHIRGKAVDNCWDQATDVAFFDALVETVESTWCADAARRFATGYSSGAFLTHLLACDRSDVLRGVATIGGGQPGNVCTDPVAAMLFHDTDDGTVAISNSEQARDARLAQNGCDAAAAVRSVDPPPCESYTGCDAAFPVVWCQTSGQDHARQDNLTGPAFWAFLDALSP